MKSMDRVKGKVNAWQAGLKWYPCPCTLYLYYLTLAMVCARALCMPTVVMVLAMAARIEEPDTGSVTQDTAAMDRMGLYPHSPEYT